MRLEARDWLIAFGTFEELLMSSVTPSLAGRSKSPSAGS
jgi:hypothetical protein